MVLLVLYQGWIGVWIATPCFSAAVHSENKWQVFLVEWSPVRGAGSCQNTLQRSLGGSVDSLSAARSCFTWQHWTMQDSLQKCCCAEASVFAKCFWRFLEQSGPAMQLVAGWAPPAFLSSPAAFNACSALWSSSVRYHLEMWVVNININVSSI